MQWLTDKFRKSDCLVLCGTGGSGKTTLAKALEDNGFDRLTYDALFQNAEIMRGVRSEAEKVLHNQFMSSSIRVTDKNKTEITAELKTRLDYYVESFLFLHMAQEAATSARKKVSTVIDHTFLFKEQRERFLMIMKSAANIKPKNISLVWVNTPTKEAVARAKRRKSILGLNLSWDKLIAQQSALFEAPQNQEHFKRLIEVRPDENPFEKLRGAGIKLPANAVFSVGENDPYTKIKEMGLNKNSTRSEVVAKMKELGG